MDATADNIIKSGESGALRRFDLTGSNSMRRIVFEHVVFARSASAAVAAADRWRDENNKVRAEHWSTRPGF